MTDPTDLIARVEKLTGPDREVDLFIHMDLCPSEYEGKWSWDDDTRPPHLTASIDAAVALVERVLPGAEMELTNLYNIARATLHHEAGPFYGSSAINSLPIAICLAVLRALQGKADER